MCTAGYVDAIIGGEHKCLRAGEFCSPSYESDYERYGFTCVDGHLKDATPTTTTAPTTTAPATTTTTTTSELATAVLSVTSFESSDGFGGQASTTCTPASGTTVVSGLLAWGDGQSTSVGAQASKVVHIYAADGSYTATLTCTDSDGQTVETSQPVPTFAVTTTSTVTTPITVGPGPVGIGSSTGSTPSQRVALGHTVKIAARTQTQGCTRLTAARPPVLTRGLFQRAHQSGALLDNLPHRDDPQRARL